MKYYFQWLNLSPRCQENSVQGSRISCPEVYCARMKSKFVFGFRHLFGGCENQMSDGNIQCVQGKMFWSPGKTVENLITRLLHGHFLERPILIAANHILLNFTCHYYRSAHITILCYCRNSLHIGVEGLDKFV